MDELAEGAAKGIDLPELRDLSWIEVRSPASVLAQSLIADLGPGETQVLMLALEIPGSIAILDDRLARRIAELKGIPVTGTLGLLLSAKRAGIINEVRPSINKLEELRFRLAAQTRTAILELAGEK